MGSLATLLGYSALFLKKGKKTNGGQFVLGHKKSAVFWIVRCFFFYFCLYTRIHAVYHRNRSDRISGKSLFVINYTYRDGQQRSW